MATAVQPGGDDGTKTTSGDGTLPGSPWGFVVLLLLLAVVTLAAERYVDQFTALLAFLVIIVVGFLVPLGRRRFVLEKFRQGGPNKPKGPTGWWAILLLLIFEACGVLASFYVLQPLFSGRNVFVLTFIIAAANLAGFLQSLQKDEPVSPVELFGAFKDGLLWTAAFPVFAAALHIPSA